MNVRPYVLMSNTTLEQMERRFLEITAEWSADWGLADIRISVDCARAWEALPSGEEYKLHKNEDKHIWFNSSAKTGLEQVLMKNMFPSDRRLETPQYADTGIALAAVKRAISDLFDRISVSCGIVSESVAHTEGDFSALYGLGSGALSVQMKIDEKILHCLLNHRCAREMDTGHKSTMEQAAPLYDLQEALQDIRVTLPIELGNVEVSVASLMSLNVNDVVRLETSVNAPLEIRNEKGVVLFNAYLGKREGMIAIEIAK